MSTVSDCRFRLCHQQTKTGNLCSESINCEIRGVWPNLVFPVLLQFGSRIARASNRRDFGSNRAANASAAGGASFRKDRCADPS